ncbi:ERMES complex subunit mmm1 [Tulasnella sp. 424]|nr:ERMES complex subunit mmm1 [Tulasnella sp. 424]
MSRARQLMEFSYSQDAIKVHAIDVGTGAPKLVRARILAPDKQCATSVTVTPPLPSDPSPCLTLTLDPSFTLDIKTNSLLGSRAKLSDVPKVHELIAQRIRSSLASRGTWKILLPGVRAKDVVDMLEKKQ